MDFSNIKNKFFVVLCVFVVFLPFILMTNIYASEPVDFEVINNLTISGSNNFFSTNSSSSANVIYFDCSPDYKYTFTNSSQSTVFKIGFCDTVPANNVVCERVLDLQAGETSSLIPTSGKIYIASTVNNTNYITITREPIEGMNSTINNLVDNVGVNSIWNVFDTGINYIYVVVLAAFGIFIITLVIRKITKGKEGF